MTDDEGLGAAEDAVHFLVAQHAHIEALFAEVDGASGQSRAEAFRRLRSLLAVHETAEEEVVHPTARRVLTDGDLIVNVRLQEEILAKQELVGLEELDVASEEFQLAFEKWRTDVLRHADAEEREEFPRLAGELDDAQLRRMRAAVRLAEAVAPTRPHPGVALAGENLLVGPFAAMLDRARDLISRP
ncbi:MAG: hemerythrin [Pseudonocardiales bacterium]|nr:hemerythrin [Pseudonocardiales bacterium]